MSCFDREKRSAVLRKAALILLTILLIGGFLFGIVWLIGKPIYQKKMDETRDFRVEFIGYALVNPTEDPGAQATISFHGEKNGWGMFAGDVTVMVDGETVYECLDCEFRGEKGSGTYALITDGGWTPDQDCPRPTNVEATIWVDQDWECVLLIPADSGADYCAFVAPAQTHGEALVLYHELYGTEKG